MSIYDQFNADITRYLSSKLPEMPESTQMEIGEYICGRVNRLVIEVYDEHEKKMDRMAEKHARRIKSYSKPDGDS